MPTYLYLAPAGAGKTNYVLERARRAAQNLGATPRLLLPNHLHVRACRRRLAQAGGAIGVRLLTFDRLYTECLNAAGEVYTELTEPVQYRLIRTIIAELPLQHYAPLCDSPGFVQALQELIAELKAARVWPENFAQAIADLEDEPRLNELAQIYAAYQTRLQEHGWADRLGLGWLAVESLEERAPHVGCDWPLLLVDGFAELNQVQLSLLNALSGRVGQLIVSLTGSAQARPAQRRFARARQRLQAALGVEAKPLPNISAPQAPALAHLEAQLFAGRAAQAPAGGAVELLQAAERPAEVRAALRWLKARAAQDGLHLHEIALLARDIAPYRPFIQQIAAEFGLPIRLLAGLPLSSNPAIAALLDMLRLMLPLSENTSEPALPRRLLLETWRSPYFDWSAQLAMDAPEPIGIQPQDADALDTVARWGRVIGGLSQWQDALDRLVGRSLEKAGRLEETEPPPNLPAGPMALALCARFGRFVQRLTPPAGERSYRDFVAWLETLIGPDPTLQTAHYPTPPELTALNVVACIRDAGSITMERDVAALLALKDVLRGLVWAEETLDSALVNFAQFFDELLGAIDAASYRLPVDPQRDEITVADLTQTRGVSWRAVALVGLAEGEFPATLRKDAFLPDAERERLALDPSSESIEMELFYEAIACARERLLLTRPRLADNGALWQPSPFWEEVCRLLMVEPQQLTSASALPPEHSASWPELMESLACARPDEHQAVRDWVQQQKPTRLADLETSAQLFVQRRVAAVSRYQGGLADWTDHFAQYFGPEHVWSASRLETYRACPFFFFVSRVLNLEPRGELAEGLDAAQLGTIYHHIFERLYQAVPDPSSSEQLLSALPDVAQDILDAAPEQQGFRETAWWRQTCQEIVENVRLSLLALAECAGDFTPLQHEAAFGLQGQPPLLVLDGDDCFQLRGLIDRVDRAPDGRLQVIDYKTGGPYAYTRKAVEQGKKLQLPLYALAAQQALGLGQPVEGFYWHVRHAEASGFSLSGFAGGPQGAMALAVEKAWESIRGARGGHFTPVAPDGGCPAYCPAVGFCWQYRVGY